MRGFVTLALALLVAAPDATALRTEGTKLFRAKKFEAACAKFEAASRLVPDDPEPLADWALCEQRLGHDDRARELNNKVIAVASAPPARRDDERYARHRRHAYFNLDRLETGPREGGGGKDRQQHCSPLAAVQGCDKQLHECTVSKADGWAARLLDMTHVRLAATAEGARFDESDILDLEEADFTALEAPPESKPIHVAAGENIQYIEAYREEGRDYQCDDKEWSCDESEAVSDAALTCTNAGAKRGKAPAEVEPVCRKTACARATAKPWPAVRREQKAIARAASDCVTAAAAIDGEYGCHIVHADPCTGLLGLVCSGHAGGVKRTRTRVEEYLFEQPK